MFVKDNKNLPPNILWLEETKAKEILKFLPEISRRVNSKGNTEIGFIESKELRDKMKELKIC